MKSKTEVKDEVQNKHLLLQLKERLLNHDFVLNRSNKDSKNSKKSILKKILHTESLLAKHDSSRQD